MVPTSDQIGRLAELVAATDLSRPVGGRYGRVLFSTTHLGDRYPTVDYLVDVLGPRGVSLAFFFVQVKGTSRAAPAALRLPVEVGTDRFNRLVRLPAPTYLIGVDVVTELSYLVTVNRPRQADMSSITKAYCLRDDAIKIQLYREVLDFWQTYRPALQRTRFRDVRDAELHPG